MTKVVSTYGSQKTTLKHRSNSHTPLSQANSYQPKKKLTNYKMPWQYTENIQLKGKTYEEKIPIIPNTCGETIIQTPWTTCKATRLFEEIEIS